VTTRVLSSLVALTLLTAVPTAAADLARYILPPGNFGGIPPSENSTDQLPLYAGLTPLRGDVTRADIDQFYLPEDFQPIAPAREEDTGRPGLTLLYDAYGVPHVYGATREDVAFGAGWVTARDRGLLLQVGRGPARVAVADVPNIDAFSWSPACSRSPRAQGPRPWSRETCAPESPVRRGRPRILVEAQAADGVNAYWAAGGDQPPYREKRRRDHRVHPARSSAPAVAPRRRTRTCWRSSRASSAPRAATRPGRT
jgi:hypothetical protein